MFVDELSPLIRELASQPVAFLGGFVSGVLRLNLNDDPVKTWLDQQAGRTTYSMPSPDSQNGSSKPQSISID